MKHDLVELLTALLTPIIAVVTTYIAVQQYRANRLKLRHDLFSQRIAIFKTIMNFIDSVPKEGVADLNSLNTLLTETRDGFFFFGPTVSKYVTKLRNKATDLRYRQEQLASPRLLGDTDAKEVGERIKELLTWFRAQENIARGKFANQLSLASEQPLSGNVRLGIVVSVVWLVVSVGLYSLGFFTFARPFAYSNSGLYDWRPGPTIITNHYETNVHPHLWWPALVTLSLSPIAFSWLVLLVIPRTFRWIKAGFIAQD